MVTKHPVPGLMVFLKRTIAAQLHLLGAIGALVGLFVLLNIVSQKMTPNHYWACMIFGITSVMVFATSSIYHFLSDGFVITKELADWLENLDHFAIYLFIAGTYTAVLMNAVATPWANILLVAVWVIAALGVLYTHFKPRLPKWAQHRFVYTGLFLAMGWLFIFRIGEIVNNLAHTTIIPFILGGLSYSLGAVFYATKWPRMIENVFGFHELWHIMVILGYGFHYYVIFKFYTL